MTNNAAIDPDWPGDLSIEEEMAERQRLREALSDDAIRDMVCDCLTDDMVATIRRHGINHHPKVPDTSTIGENLMIRMGHMIEAYIEHELRQRR